MRRLLQEMRARNVPDDKFNSALEGPFASCTKYVIGNVHCAS